MSENQSPSDQVLLSGVLKRDAHAFERLFERYAGALHRHLLTIVHDESAAHDLVQETFLRVWTRAEQWHGGGSVKAWVYRIATNTALNHLRTVRRRREQPLELPSDPDDDEDTGNRVPAWMIDASALGPEAAVELAEQRSLCRRLVARLPEDKQQVLRLVHEMELSIRDVADMLDIPEGTVKSRLYYARKDLAREWQASESESETAR